MKFKPSGETKSSILCLPVVDDSPSTMELKEQPEDIAKRPEKILNWRLREFDEQGMLNSVRALEGKKVI